MVLNSSKDLPCIRIEAFKNALEIDADKTYKGAEKALDNDGENEDTNQDSNASDNATEKSNENAEDAENADSG